MWGQIEERQEEAGRGSWIFGTFVQRSPRISSEPLYLYPPRKVIDWGRVAGSGAGGGEGGGKLI